MSSVSIFQPAQFHNPVLSQLQVLQLTRPTFKTEFVRRGDETHLLVYLNDDQGLPFVRIPCEVLVQAARVYEKELQ
ncbi:conserved hypothetical protein [Vibrio crassostreae]|nr:MULTISPECIES: hypothetical protein [Vibrio]OBT29138.1 hypothetical protein A9263_03515 [Vibrio cyclitrophicus]PMJ91635.1 hypothetical protein BCU13_22915 [Vibrio lentus]TKF54062.1 hypothetical protein FCV51_20310 [Vibrio kanaloae]CAK2499444.1 conserved hypothetical protein [Vibrio crassostreae]